MSNSPQERKPAPLRITVPPTGYCPFNTDLTLPVTPPSLLTPGPSSCFTFSNMQEPAGQGTSVPSPPAPPPALLSWSQNRVVPNFASPTSSQFLLMPPTPYSEDMANEAVIRVSPFASPATANESMNSGSHDPKPGNSPPWEVSSSTWLSDLGGHTETDRIFRHNLEVISVDTGTSPASTPALSPSTVSPSSQASSLLVHSVRASPARSPALSPYSHTMSPRSSSPACLALKPTGTDTFPSTLDNLQAWRESVTPGIPQSGEPCSPLTENAHGAPFGELMSEPTIHPSTSFHQPQSRRFSPRVFRIPKTQTFVRRAKIFGGRVKQLVTRQGVSKYCGSMDRGVDFRVVTTPDSERGSVILVTAPPPPYDAHPLAPTPHNPTDQEQARSRTVSEYSSVTQASIVEATIPGSVRSNSRQGGGNGNALRRLSLAALSTIKRF